MVLILLFFWRLHKYLGNYDKTKRIDKILYIAIQRPNRLTIDSTNRNRGIYSSNFRKWLNQGNYYIGFPLQKRPYNVPTDMLP